MNSPLADNIASVHIQVDAVRQVDVVRLPLPEFNRPPDFQSARKISKDVEIAHSRHWPTRPMSRLSCLWLPLISPGLRLIWTHRMVHWLYLKRKHEAKRQWLWRSLLVPVGLAKLLMMRINSKSEIAPDCEIEDGVCFSDQGNIIFGATKTGTGTVIGTRVTVGMGHTDKGRPKIGRNVWIGSDCVIFGSICIGDGATLLPGTVLTKNIPAGVVIQGNPPRLVQQNFDNSELRKTQSLDAVQYVNMKHGG
ncbi:MAG: serine O-acetyltransferase [Methylobacter sp.]